MSQIALSERATPKTYLCGACLGGRVVCGLHPDKPWNTGLDADCPCGGHGTPCLECAPLPAGIQATIELAA